MQFLSNLWEGILEIPSFTIILLFKMGWYSLLIWISILFCTVTSFIEFRDQEYENAKEFELEQERLRAINLKRYKK